MQISLFRLSVKLQRGNYVYYLAHDTAVCRSPPAHSCTGDTGNWADPHLTNT